MERQPAPPEHTSGTETREPRPMGAELMAHGLQQELDRLTREPAWREGDRDSLTLFKGPDLRVVVTLLRSGARIGDDQAHGSMSIQVLSGSLAIARDRDALEVGTGELVAVEAGGGWSVEAREESAVLLTMAWPEERSLV